MVRRKGNHQFFTVGYIALLVATLLVSCFQELGPSSETKYSTFNQSENFLTSWFLNRNILIKKVHDKSWRIGIKYDEGTNFTPAQKKELETAVEEAFNVWLEPIRAFSKEYTGREDVVAEFEFIEMKPLPPLRRYQKREPREPVDLEITFENTQGRSYWKPKSIGGIGTIHIFKEPNAFVNNKIPRDASVGYSWNTLQHENGHAIGLDDSYAEGRGKSTGGSSITSGKHAESVMSGLGQFINDKKMKLTHDDIAGVQALYRYHVLGYRDEKTCVSDELTWDKGSKGCIPRYPVIYAVKYGNENILSRLLQGDPNVDVNEKDPLGNTALHKAIELMNDGMVSTLLDIDLRGQDIDVKLTNNEEQTVLHLLVANEYSPESGNILDRLLELGANLSAEDNQGKTAYDYAQEYNAELEQNPLGGGEQKFPNDFLDKINPANAEEKP